VKTSFADIRLKAEDAGFELGGEMEVRG